MLPLFCAPCSLCVLTRSPFSPPLSSPLPPLCRYTHDSECVIYSGPDAAYQGREVCFNYNEDTLTVVDVTDKDHMQMLARVGYEGAKYTHQVKCRDSLCLCLCACVCLSVSIFMSVCLCAVCSSSSLLFLPCCCVVAY